MNSLTNHLRHSVRRRVCRTLRGSILATALGLMSLPALQAQIEWIGGTGGFSDGANWSGGQVPYGSNFSVANGGTAQVTTTEGTTEIASISSSSTVELLSDASARLSVGADLKVGAVGRGTLILGNQGILYTWQYYASTANSYFGLTPGSEGVLISTGGNYTTVTLYNGMQGSGNMTLSAGSILNTETAYFGFEPLSFGAMSLANSSWTIASSGIFGYGDLTVAQGGSGRLVASSSQILLKNLTLSATSGVNATVALTGGNLTASEDIFVGMNGTASFSANASAIVQARQLFVGRNAGASGTATISGGNLTLSQDLHVGALGNGTLTLENGGSVSSDIANIGFGSNAAGEINVLGGNWTNTRAIFVGVSGNGTLRIGAGGRISSESGYVGHNASGVGAIHLDGGTWTMSNTLAIGVNGTASLTANGGMISSEWGQIGLHSGSHGVASLSNSTWTVGQTLTIGDAGDGSLTLTSGSNVAANGIELAASGGVNGSLVVADSTVTTVNLLAGSGSASVSFSSARLQLPTNVQVVDTLLIDGFAPGAVVIGNGGLTVDTRGGNAIIPTVLSGNGSLTKAGAGRLRLSATNSLSGGVIVQGGALEITASGVLGTGPTILKTGELRATGNVTLSDSNPGSPPSIAISANQSATFSAVTGQTFTVGTSAFLIGTGASLISGSAGNNGSVVFAPGNVTVSSPVTQISVATGSLVAGNNALGQLTLTASSTAVAAGATLDFQDNLAAGGINALFGAGTVNTGSNTTSTLAVNSGNFSGSIAGWGGLAKNSVGTLVLSGNSSFTGGTRVNEGTLVVNGSLGFGLGNVWVFPSGTLGGSGKVGAITLAGGTLAPGNSAGTLTGGSLYWEGGTILFDLGPTSDLLVLNGALFGLDVPSGPYTFDFVDAGWSPNTTYNLITFSSTDIDKSYFNFSNGGGFAGDFNIVNGNTLQFTMTAIPEPSTWALLFAAALLGAIRLLSPNSRPASGAGRRAAGGFQAKDHRPFCT
ncbi:MAG: autotransporter-associated beta strand repeat-containing protein [Verrucomicrobia bacterium]|nr:autotransporter-associated beta strand repeat-containing protein [Verrucomicrobiota bacterium]